MLNTQSRYTIMTQRFVALILFVTFIASFSTMFALKCYVGDVDGFTISDLTTNPVNISSVQLIDFKNASACIECARSTVIINNYTSIEWTCSTVADGKQRCSTSFGSVRGVPVHMCSCCIDGCNADICPAILRSFATASTQTIFLYLIFVTLLLLLNLQ